MAERGAQNDPGQIDINNNFSLWRIFKNRATVKKYEFFVSFNFIIAYSHLPKQRNP